jgi:hypothetical protein
MRGAVPPRAEAPDEDPPHWPPQMRHQSRSCRLALWVAMAGVGVVVAVGLDGVG